MSFAVVLVMVVLTSGVTGNLQIGTANGDEQTSSTPQLADVPDMKAQQEAKKQIKQTFNDEYSRTNSPAGKLLLARKLFKQNGDFDDKNVRYVLLREVLDLATEVGEARLAFSAIDQLAKGFQVDQDSMRLNVLKTAVRSARHRDLIDGVGYVALDWVPDLISRDQFATASRVASLGRTAGQKAKNGHIVSLARHYEKQARGLQREYRKIRVPVADLQGNPDDANANLAVGRFYCFVKEDWKSGLSLLGKGADSTLRSLAYSELKQPSAADEQVDLGNRWSVLATAQPIGVRLSIRRHAKYWFTKALPNLKGLVKASVRRKIKQIPTPTVQLFIRSNIEGVDTMTLSADGMRWRNDAFGLPDSFSINQLDWDLRKKGTVINNRGATRIFPNDVDFSTARMVKKKGRGKVSLSVNPDSIVVTFDDGPQGGPDVYEILIQFGK
jgi:hypothetical protein